MSATPATEQAAYARMEDTELAPHAARRDAAALRVLMRRHNPRLFRTARAILRDDGEAEEAVQEAWLKAIAALPGFRGESRLGTWLVRIAANEALSRRRKLQRGAEVIPLAGDLPDALAAGALEETPMPDPEDQAMRAQTRRIVESRIDALPDAFRVVFVLRALEELTVEETALALGIPEATVRTRYFRARAQLRATLAAEVERAVDDAYAFAGERCERIAAAVLARLGLAG